MIIYELQVFILSVRKFQEIFLSDKVEDNKNYSLWDEEELDGE
jgi:hypothetical protein